MPYVSSGKTGYGSIAASLAPVGLLPFRLGSMAFNAGLLPEDRSLLLDFFSGNFGLVGAPFLLFGAFAGGAASLCLRSTRSKASICARVSVTLVLPSSRARRIRSRACSTSRSSFSRSINCTSWPNSSLGPAPYSSSSESPES